MHDKDILVFKLQNRLSDDFSNDYWYYSNFQVNKKHVQ